MISTCLVVLGLLAFFAVMLGTVSWNFNKSIQGGLVNASEAVTVTANGSVYANGDAVAGVAGTLTTMSTSTTGSLTMPNGHGLITGQRVDIYWTGGQCYGAVLGTVSGNTVPVASVSGGSALPASGTAVVVSPTKSVPFEVIGDNVVALAAGCGLSAGYVVFSTNSADLLAKFLQPGVAFNWKSADGTNPLGTGVTPTKVYFSQASSTNGTNTAMFAAALTN